ncbi:MAG: hypothetical protein JXB32_05225 [Deltaproteobacteria bacterium]|nr:hypothetical protein [Deltaproteobacteria bacterium]
MSGRRVLGMAAAALAAAAACTVTVSFWSGSESSASLDWTINGNAPSAALCAAVGGDYVVLRVADGNPGCTPGTEGCGETHDNWVWDCAAGTADTGLTLKPATLHMAWALVAADGTVREATAWSAVTLRSGANGFTFDFTPGWVGAPDAAAVSTWTLDGAAADAASCVAAGAETVRLTYRIAGATGETSESYACADGTATTGNIFRMTQRYEFRWELLDAAGTALSVAPATGWQAQTMAAGDNPFTVAFAGPTGPDATVAASWTIRGAAADAASCDDALGTTVRLHWREAGTVDDATVDWTCADGTGTTAELFDSSLDYELAWELLDAEEHALVRIDWAAFEPVAGENVQGVDFLVGGRLTVTLEWADKLADPAWGGCTLPPDDVAELGYELEDPATSTVFDAIDLATAPMACAATLEWTNVPFATWTLTVDGRAASPATATWHAECTDIVVDAVTGNTATCQVAMTAS